MSELYRRKVCRGVDRPAFHAKMPVSGGGLMAHQIMLYLHEGVRPIPEPFDSIKVHYKTQWVYSENVKFN